MHEKLDSVIVLKMEKIIYFTISITIFNGCVAIVFFIKCKCRGKGNFCSYFAYIQIAEYMNSLQGIKKKIYGIQY